MYLFSETIGTGADAEGNQIRPVVDLYIDTWTCVTDAPGIGMLVKCEPFPEVDTDARIRRLRRELLNNVAPDDGETDDSDALALKIGRRFVLRQWLSADDFAVNSGALDLTLSAIPAARRNRIRNRLLERGIDITGLSLQTTIRDALRFILPQFQVRLQSRPASPSGTFIDTFTEATTDTNLVSHTPDTGTGWTRVDGVDNAAFVRASDDRLLSNNATNTLYICDDQGSADQYHEWVFNVINASFVVNRATDSNNFIGSRAQNTPAKLQIFKRVTGTFTQLGSNGATTIVAGDTARLESDSADAHELYLNGASQVGPVTDTAHNTVTRQGVVGRSTTAQWIDYFEAGVLSAAGTRPKHLALLGVS
jgi:hypothetical protein